MGLEKAMRGARRRMLLTPAVALAVVAALAVTLAGCGSAGSASSPGTAAASSPAAGSASAATASFVGIGLGLALEPVAVPALDQPPCVAHGQRDHRLHRVDADRAGEQAGVGHDQPGYAVELTEAAGHPAPRIFAHPRGAHQVDREELEGPLRYRPGQQAPQL